MVDWFAAFAEERSPEHVATLATPATNNKKPQNTQSYSVPNFVACAETGVATVATIPSPVAGVASDLNRVVTGKAGDKSAGNSNIRDVVATVAGVASENHRSGDKSSDNWDTDDWRAFYDERAGIAEHMGEASQAEADARAFECTVVAWLNSHPAPDTGHGACVHCGNDTPAGDALPFLNGGGYVWLHSDCHTAWMERRRADAIAALKKMVVKKFDDAE